MGAVRRGWADDAEGVREAGATRGRARRPRGLVRARCVGGDVGAGEGTGATAGKDAAEAGAGSLRPSWEGDAADGPMEDCGPVEECDPEMGVAEAAELEGMGYAIEKAQADDAARRRNVRRGEYLNEVGKRQDGTFFVSLILGFVGVPLLFLAAFFVSNGGSLYLESSGYR